MGPHTYFCLERSYELLSIILHWPAPQYVPQAMFEVKHLFFLEGLRGPLACGVFPVWWEFAGNLRLRSILPEV
jgi:hypothetical protein